VNLNRFAANVLAIHSDPTSGKPLALLCMSFGLAFWRVVIDERSPAEVAAELGITANAVRQAKSRVLRRLKEEMGELIA
jgi:Sigma-70, region 4